MIIPVMKAAADNNPRPIASTEELLQYLNIENKSEAHELVLTKFSELFREYKSNTENENANFSKFDLYEPQPADNFISIADSTSCHLAFCTEYYYNKIKYLCSNRLIISGNSTGISEVCLAIDQELFAPTILAQASYSDFRTRLLAGSQSMYLIGHTTPEVFIKHRMQLGGADLHIHTTASDSSDTPEQVCNRVFEAKLRTFAITDHDNTEAAALVETYLADKTSRLQEEVSITSDETLFVPGVEISVQEERELHLLAYFPYGGYERILEFLQEQQQARERRNLDMIARLQALGYDISIDELNASGDFSVGRMQMALLLKARGYVKTTSQAFAELLGYGQPGYVERPRPSLSEAIRHIRLAGGVAVLAHPALYGWCRPRGSAETRKLLLNRFKTYKSWGLSGIEAYHGEAEKQEQQLLSDIAIELRLLRTGGSDDHGRNKSHTSLFSGNIKFY
ncbi:MAG: PHP domain-containing protein [Eubacteriales bacterium]|nr:PHP domain-containing protein [Eubacteriales bacterium]